MPEAEANKAFKDKTFKYRLARSMTSKRLTNYYCGYTKVNRTILSVINQKGGVGKTTTVINLSTALAQQNNKILIIDLDPQGNATTGLGKSNSDEQNNVYNLLINKVSLENSVQSTEVKNLDLIPSNVNLSGLEVETANEPNRAFILKEIIDRNSRISSRYDYILTVRLH